MAPRERHTYPATWGIVDAFVQAHPRLVRALASGAALDSQAAVSYI